MSGLTANHTCGPRSRTPQRETPCVPKSTPINQNRKTRACIPKKTKFSSSTDTIHPALATNLKILRQFQHGQKLLQKALQFSHINIHYPNTLIITIISAKLHTLLFLDQEKNNLKDTQPSTLPSTQDSSCTRNHSPNLSSVIEILAQLQVPRTRAHQFTTLRVSRNSPPFPPARYPSNSHHLTPHTDDALKHPILPAVSLP